jgi:hypothetical protein
MIAVPAQAQTLTVLHNFALDEDGASPGKGIAVDGHGRFYGTTQYGGDLNCDGGGPAGCGGVSDSRTRVRDGSTRRCMTSPPNTALSQWIPVFPLLLQTVVFTT